MGGGTSLNNALRNARIEGVAEKVRFERGDARNVPYPDEYFDKVVTSFAIHIIRGNEREKAFKEMLRVLKPRGILAMLEPPRELVTRWKVNDKLKTTLENLGLRNVKFHPFIINYPKRRTVYLIVGVKASALYYKS